MKIECPNCGQTKKFDAVNGHCDGIHTIFFKCKNPKCNYEFVVSDGMLIGKYGEVDPVVKNEWVDTDE